MKLLDRLNKPECVLRPGLLLRAGLRVRPDAGNARRRVRLPWGMPLVVHPEEVIGSSIARRGVYDLALSEVLWRLLDPGGRAIDVGANIGYMTSIMARRLRPLGSVIAFEPHPEVYAELTANVRSWRDFPGLAPVTVREAAVAATAAEITLHEPADFVHGRGGSSINRSGMMVVAGRSFAVRAVTLDQVIPAGGRVDLLKVDVEGAELAVFEGARRLLEQRRVRDILFEDHGGFPSPVMQLLHAHGYRLFGIGQRFSGPRLSPPWDVRGRRYWEPPSYLATLAPERARRRIALPGWKVLAPRR